MLDWHGRFKADPYSAREAWIRTWAQQPPFRMSSKAATSPAKAPEGMREAWRPDWQRDEDIKAAYKAAVADKNDRDAYASTAELRQQVKQQTGLSLIQFMDICKQIDEASSTDAVAIADKFARFSGVPATQAQAAEVQHAAQHQALYENLAAG